MIDTHTTQYIEEIVAGWEEAYKKGQLTFWVLLALKDGAKHMGEIKVFIAYATGGTLTVDDKSLYRALRRYHEAELANFNTIPGDKGPDRKEYSLTPIGQEVLRQFVQRNISNVFYRPEIKSLIERNDNA